MKTGGEGAGHRLPKACIGRCKPREGESMRGGFPSYKGVRGPPPGDFLKLGLPESAFPCYFQVIFINLAG